MNIEKLYAIAEKNEITIIENDLLKQTASCSVRLDNTYYIGMNEALESRDKTVHIAHELGHCLSGAMYNMYAPLDNRCKHELRADRWAIKALIPLDDLKKAIQAGITQKYELAEYFGVTEELVDKAFAFYNENNLLI